MRDGTAKIYVSVAFEEKLLTIEMHSIPQLDGAVDGDDAVLLVEVDGFDSCGNMFELLFVRVVPVGTGFISSPLVNGLR